MRDVKLTRGIVQVVGPSLTGLRSLEKVLSRLCPIEPRRPVARSRVE
jgi:hypothetical protein